MLRFKRIRAAMDNSLLRLAFFIVLVAVTMIALLGVSSSVVFSKRYNQAIIRFDTKVLQYTKNTIDNVLFKKIETSVINAYMNEEERKALLYFAENPLDGNYAKTAEVMKAVLRLQQSLGDLPAAIQVYIPSKGLIFSSREGMLCLSDNGQTRYTNTGWIGSYEQEIAPNGWIGPYTDIGIDHKPQQKVAYVKPYPFASPFGDCAAAVAVILTEEGLRGKLDEIGSDNFSNLFLMNPDGMIVSHGDKSMVGMDVSEEEFAQQIVSGSPPDPYSHFSGSLDGEAMIFSWVQSTSTRFYYISATSPSLFYAESLWVRQIILLACLGTALVVLMVTTVLSSRLTKPFTRLFQTAKRILSEQQPGIPENTRDVVVLDETLHLLNERVTDLSGLLSRNRVRISHTFYINLFMGSRVDPVEAEESLQFIGQRFNGEGYICALILPDIRRLRLMELEESEYLLYRIAEKLTDDHPNLAALVVDRSTVALLCGGGEDFDLLLPAVLRFVQKEFKMNVWFAVGEQEALLTNVHISLEKAREAAKQIPLYGEQSVFRVNGKQTAVEGSLAAELLETLPDKIDVKGTSPSASLGDWGASLKALGEPEELAVLRALFPTSLQSYLLKLGLHLPDAYLEDLKEELQAAFLLEEVLSVMEKSLGQAAQTASARYYGGSLKYVEKAKEYVEQGLGDPALSLETTADFLGITSAHFSRIFKETSGESYIDFVTRRRMEFAKKLLCETALPISKVAEKAGFSNANYFNKRFKTFFSVTPTQFRKAAGRSPL